MSRKFIIIFKFNRYLWIDIPDYVFGVMISGPVFAPLKFLVDVRKLMYLVYTCLS